MGCLERTLSATFGRWTASKNAESKHSKPLVQSKDSNERLDAHLQCDRRFYRLQAAAALLALFIRFIHTHTHTLEYAVACLFVTSVLLSPPARATRRTVFEELSIIYRVRHRGLNPPVLWPNQWLSP